MISMQKQDDFFDTALPTNYTKRWNPRSNEELLEGIYFPMEQGSAFVVDAGGVVNKWIIPATAAASNATSGVVSAADLRNTAWTCVNVVNAAVAPQVQGVAYRQQVPGAVGYLTFACPASEIVTYEKALPQDLAWLSEAQGAVGANISSDTLIRVINGINVLLKARKFDFIDLILRTMEITSAPTEIPLTVLRVTYPVRTRLAEWRRFLSEFGTEIVVRGFDPAVLLKGLS